MEHLGYGKYIHKVPLILNNLLSLFLFTIFMIFQNENRIWSATMKTINIDSVNKKFRKHLVLC